MGVNDRTNLDPFYRPVSSPLNPQIDASVFSLPVEGIGYSALSTDARGATAVISLGGEQGTFKDFQLALNFVDKNGGGTVLFKKGTYIIENDVTVYSNISIRGEQRETVILDFNSTTKQIDIASVENVVVESLTFANSTSTTGAINITSADKITIRECDFDTNTVDIYNQSSSNVSVRDCYSSTSATFLSLNTAPGTCQYNNCNISAPTSYAIKGATSSGGLFNNFTITNGESCAVYGSFLRATFKAFNNVFTSDSNTTDYIVEITGGSQNTFSEFYAQASSNGGVKLPTGSGSNRIVNSFFWLYGDSSRAVPYGIEVGAANKTVVTGNTILAGSASAVYVNGGGNNVIQGNAITGSGGTVNYGVWLTTNADDNVVVGNSISAQKYGVYLDGSTCDKNVVVGNRVTAVGTAIYDNATNTVNASNAI